MTWGTLKRKTVANVCADEAVAAATQWACLLHRLSRCEHAFACAPWMDFGFDQAGFDDRIFLRQLGSLLRSRAENGDSPQFARFAEREWSGNGDLSLNFFSYTKNSIHPKGSVDGLGC